MSEAEEVTRWAAFRLRRASLGESEPRRRVLRAWSRCTLTWHGEVFVRHSYLLVDRSYPTVRRAQGRVPGS
jgi:hypothetical protein